MSRDEQTPTNPGIRESQLAMDRGPTYQALARDLATRLYALRLSGHDESYRIACGRLACDCDALVLAFGGWSTVGDSGKRFIIREWQDVKARARRLGLEIL